MVMWCGYCNIFVRITEVITITTNSTCNIISNVIDIIHSTCGRKL